MNEYQWLAVGLGAAGLLGYGAFVLYYYKKVVSSKL